MLQNQTDFELAEIVTDDPEYLINGYINKELNIFAERRKLFLEHRYGKDLLFQLFKQTDGMSACENYFVKYKNDGLLLKNIEAHGQEKVENFIKTICKEYNVDSYGDYYGLWDDVIYSTRQFLIKYDLSDRGKDTLNALISSPEMRKASAINLMFYRPSHEFIFKYIFANSIVSSNQMFTNFTFVYLAFNIAIDILICLIIKFFIINRTIEINNQLNILLNCLRM
jgi:hypothetical protein